MAKTNYPIGDFLIRLKNAAKAGKREVDIPKTKMAKEVAKTLKREGFLTDVKDKKDTLKLKLTIRKKEPIMMSLKLVSKPGLRIYWGADDIEQKKGPETYILSTPEGILSSKEAVKKRVGGEVIAEVL